MSQRPIQTRPKISCIVPCFNEEAEILRESLSSVVNQTYKDFECIVIDESTDTKIAELCKEICASDPRFHYLHPDKRMGLAGSLNLGIQKARGEFIARFDSDDICSPNRFAIQAKFLDDNSEIGVVGSSLDIIDEKGLLTAHKAYAVNHSDIEKKFIFSNAIAHPTVMIRKSLLLSVAGGAYDPTFKYSEDLELWLRLLNYKIEFYNLAEPLVKYRQQYTNRNSDNWKFNIKARIKNFSAPYRFQKIIGILGIALWMHLPKKSQLFLFKVIQLRKP